MSSTTPAPTSVGTSGAAGWTPRLVVSLISLLCLTEAAVWVNLSTITALPRIINYFHTTHGGWLVTVSTLVGAAAAPVVGKLADLYGKRRMILVVVAVGIVGEIIGATAPAFWMLLITQVLFGALTSLLFLGYSLIRDVYPRNLVPFAASVSVTGFGVLLIGAPFLIGVLIDHFGFRSLYVFNLVWLVVTAALMLLTTRETTVRRRSRVDVLGAVLLAGGFVLILLPISMAGQWGWGSASVIGLLIGGVVVLTTYVIVALRIREPILNLRTLVRPSVLFGVLGGGLSNALALTVTTLLALLAMTPRALGGTYGLGLSATHYALLSAPFSLASVLAGIAVGVLVRRTGPRLVMYIGLGALAVGALLLTFEHDTFAKMLVSAIILGFGNGCALAAMPNLVIAGTPPLEQGSMSSAGGISAGMLSSVLTTVVFAIMTPTAKSPVPGVLVYGDSGISTALLLVAGVPFAALLIGAIFLRPRGGSAAEKRAAASPQRETAVTT